MSNAPTPTEVAEVTGIPSAGSLMEGIGEAVSNAKGTYSRLCVDGKTIAYANPRKDGVLLDFAAKTVEGAPAKLRKGTEVKGTRAVLHVTEKNAGTARELLERLAQAATPAGEGSDEPEAAA